MKYSWIFLICCLALQTLFATPAQIIILRHAEKGSNGQLVDPQGLERAAGLAYYLTETPYLQHFGPIAAVFASRQIDESDRIIPRTIETMMPVAELLQLPVHSPFNGYQTTQMANFILNNPKYEGQNIVICWNHSSIIPLLNAFGYTWPLNTSFYPNCRFDMVFVLTFPHPDQNPLFPALYFQQLLYGDATCCPGGCGPICTNPACPNTDCTEPRAPLPPCPSYTAPPPCSPCEE